jgi:hypothetical protein
MKMMRVHITLWIVLLAGGFAGGFIPEYLKNRELRAELQNPQQTIDALKLQLQMSEVRDAVSLMVLEMSRQNYGLARDAAAQFYDKLKVATDAVQDPVQKKSLQDLAATRDPINAQLVAAGPAALAAAQPILLKTFEVTKSIK